MSHPHQWNQAPNFRDPSVMRDPNPHYRRMFEYGRPFYVPEEDVWYVFDHAHVQKVFKTKSSSVNRFGGYLQKMPPEKQVILKPFFDNLSRWMTFIDDKEHRRLRAPVQKAFTSSIIKQWESWLYSTTQTLIERVQNQPRFEFVSNLALPLPLMLICEMLGIPEDDAALLKKQYWDIVAFFDNSTDPVIAKNALTSNAILFQYMMNRIKNARSSTSQNLMTYLAQLQAQNANLHDEDIAANAILILGAGHETTTSHLCSAVQIAYSNPDWLKRVQRDAHFRSTLLEEALRLNPPLQRTSRIAREGTELGGIHIQKGSRLCLLIGAANRDPKVFPNPDQADPFREKNQHLAFSAGPHFCVGANVARLEVNIMLELLSQRCSEYRLSDAPIAWEENMTFRTMKHLWLEKSQTT